MTLNAADQEFIDRMVPHHRQAVAMARMVLAHGDDSRVHRLAENVITAQTAEIKEMLSWGANPASGPHGSMGMNSVRPKPEPA